MKVASAFFSRSRIDSSQSAVWLPPLSIPSRCHRTYIFFSIDIGIVKESSAPSMSCDCWLFPAGQRLPSVFGIKPTLSSHSNQRKSPVPPRAVPLVLPALLLGSLAVKTQTC